MVEKREGFKYVASLPEGEQFVAMTVFEDKIIIASTKSIYYLVRHYNQYGVSYTQLEKIKLEVEDKVDD